jgi:hypothetical protein
MTNGSFSIACDGEYAGEFLASGFELEGQFTDGRVLLTFAGDDVAAAVGRAAEAILKGRNELELRGPQDGSGVVSSPKTDFETPTSSAPGQLVGTAVTSSAVTPIRPLMVTWNPAI